MGTLKEESNICLKELNNKIDKDLINRRIEKTKRTLENLRKLGLLLSNTYRDNKDELIKLQNKLEYGEKQESIISIIDTFNSNNISTLLVTTSYFREKIDRDKPRLITRYSKDIDETTIETLLKVQEVLENLYFPRIINVNYSLGAEEEQFKSTDIFFTEGLGFPMFYICIPIGVIIFEIKKGV